MTVERLQEILARFPAVAVAVVGDFFLDKYLIIDAALTERSLETGLEAYQVVAKRLSPGAAGTVTNNLTALEVGKVYAVSFVGDDGEGYELIQGLARRGVDITYLLRRPDLFTPTYTKPMLREAAGGERELNRLDIKNRHPLPAELEETLLAHVEAVLPKVQAVIIADQVAERCLGVITDRVRDELCALARAHPEVIFFADSRANIGLFRDLITKPNKLEVARACGYEGAEEDLTIKEAAAYGLQLAHQTGAPVYVTAGAEGMVVCQGQACTLVPAVRVPPPIDIVGAGDSATAGVVAALCAGATLLEAAVVGTCVASLTIQQLGTTGTTTRPQVLQRFTEFREQFAPF
jgi:rfaE bifunctional protein kinase chain/domain